jgi:hypothetical protein
MLLCNKEYSFMFGISGVPELPALAGRKKLIRSSGSLKILKIIPTSFVLQKHKIAEINSASAT